MAFQLMRLWSLGALRVTLDASSEEPTVRCDVVVTDGRTEAVATSVTVPLDAFGMLDRSSRQRSREPELHVPPEVLGPVADWVKSGANDRSVLWVHLVKPYGMLGGVPWEDLAPAAGIPVLRLPDVLPGQRPVTRRVQIAVVTSAPEVKGPSPLESLPQLLQGLGEMQREIAVTLFCDEERRPEVEAIAAATIGGYTRWETAEWDPAVIDPTLRPETSSHRGRRPASRSLNPWLQWIVGATKRRSFDMVHFLCHGYLTGQEGVLALAPTPVDMDPDRATHIGAAALNSFLTRVGAFGLVITSPNGNRSVGALRLLADAVGANRAGPVVFHDAAAADGGIGYAYRLVLGYEQEVVAPGPGYMIYVQPELVAGGEGMEDESPDRGISFESEDSSGGFEVTPFGGTETDALLEEQAENPAWLSVLARFIDEKNADLAAYRKADRAGQLSSQGKAYAAGVEKAIRQLDSMARSYVEGPS